MLKAYYYNSIDTLPAFNYLQIVEHEKHEYLIIKKGYFGNYEKAFENIQRQLVDRFGINEFYLKHLQLRKEICLLKCEIALTGDRFNLTWVKMKEIELSELEQRKSTSNEEIKVIIEKYLGFRLDLQIISVADWFGYLKNFSTWQKAQR